MNYNNFLKMIRKGQMGGNRGLSFGLPRFSRIVPDLQKGMYYLVGGESGSGKTSFVDDRMVLAPFEAALEQNKPIKGIYFSFEMDTLSKIARMASRRLYQDKGVLVTSGDLLGYNQNKLPEHTFQAVKGYDEYFEEFFKRFTIHDHAKGPLAIKNDLQAFSETIGKWEGEDFIENDPDCTYLIVIDHIGLIQRNGMSKKEAMDILSSILIYYRNKCKMTFVVVAQFNRNISSTDRFNINRVIPQMSDFADTSSLIQDCNKAFGLFSPAKYGFEEYLGYRINSLEDNFRSLHILKNREGITDRMIPLRFIGEVGYFCEHEINR
jgi:replicative DNA helicase